MWEFFVFTYVIMMVVMRMTAIMILQIASVDECVISINSKMQYQLDMERLEAIMTKIEPYDCVEPPSEECVKVSECLFFCFWILKMCTLLCILFHTGSFMHACFFFF